MLLVYQQSQIYILPQANSYTLGLGMIFKATAQVEKVNTKHWAINLMTFLFVLSKVAKNKSAKIQIS